MDIKEFAAHKRYYAKCMFGEALERGGWANQDLPMARFVDAVIDAAVLEVANSPKEITMEGMKVEVPAIPSTKHTRRFSKEEVIIALRKYLESGGITVPDGNVWLH